MARLESTRISHSTRCVRQIFILKARITSTSFVVGGGATAAGEPPAGVIHAFNAAESLRWTLVERRRALIQKEKDLADSEPPASKKQKVDGNEEERGGEIDSLGTFQLDWTQIVW